MAMSLMEDVERLATYSKTTEIDAKGESPKFDRILEPTLYLLFPTCLHVRQAKYAKQ